MEQIVQSESSLILYMQVMHRCIHSIHVYPVVMCTKRLCVVLISEQFILSIWWSSTKYISFSVIMHWAVNYTKYYHYIDVQSTYYG